MILQQFVLIKQVDLLIEEATRFRARYESDEDCFSLKNGAEDLKAKLTAFINLLPEGVTVGNTLRHIAFIVHFLGKNDKSQHDMVEICESDLPNIKDALVEYFSDEKHFDSELYAKVHKLLLVNELSSAVQKAFIVLSERIRVKFGITRKIDGAALISEAFVKNKEMIDLDDEHREAFRNILYGLYGYFRNRYSHKDLDVSISEASAVLDMVNYALLEMEIIVDIKKK
jgi:uncharacterized protein (TIGR02391 family)